MRTRGESHVDAAGISSDGTMIHDPGLMVTGVVTPVRMDMKKKDLAATASAQAVPLLRPCAPHRPLGH